MPANVTCPGCKLLFGLPDAFLGRWIACPQCGMGFAAVAEGPEAGRAEYAGDAPPVRESDYDLDDDEPMPRRSRAVPIVLCTAAVVGLAGIVALVTLAVRPEEKQQGGSQQHTVTPTVNGQPSTPITNDQQQPVQRPTAMADTQLSAPPTSIPAPTNDYDTWSHKELIAYLNNHSLTFQAVSAETGSAHGPAMYFLFPGANPAAVELLDGPYPVASEWHEVVYVQLRKSAQEARDHAGTAGDNGFSWHRFIILGDRKLVARIHAALP